MKTVYMKLVRNLNGAGKEGIWKDIERSWESSGKQLGGIWEDI